MPEENRSNNLERYDHSKLFFCVFKSDTFLLLLLVVGRLAEVPIFLFCSCKCISVLI